MARLGMTQTLGEDDEDEEDDDDETEQGDEPQQDEAEEELKPLLVQAILELVDELEVVDSTIAKDARDHVHSG